MVEVLGGHRLEVAFPPLGEVGGVAEVAPQVLLGGGQALGAVTCFWRACQSHREGLHGLYR